MRSKWTKQDEAEWYAALMKYPFFNYKIKYADGVVIDRNGFVIEGQHRLAALQRQQLCTAVIGRGRF